MNSLSVCLSAIFFLFIYIIVGITQENFTIDGPKYHWRAKYGMRERKSKKWRERFIEQQELDQKSYPFYPSPKGSTNHWMNYIEHRVKMMRPGMIVYCQRKFIRLRFDKYVEENSASDRIAAFLTRKLPSLIFIGAAQMAPNSPIGIKKRLRCPGVRKLMNSFRKFNNCVVRLVDEYKTSQTCAKCFRLFDRRTKNDRFVCYRCIPNGLLLHRTSTCQKSLLAKRAIEIIKMNAN